MDEEAKSLTGKRERRSSGFCANHNIHGLDELLAWNWAAEREHRNLAA